MARQERSWMTNSEVAEALGVSREAVRQWMVKGDLPGRKTRQGNARAQWRIERADFEAFKAARAWQFDPAWMTLGEAATWLGVHKTTLRSYVIAGSIPVWRMFVGNRQRECLCVHEDDLAAFRSERDEWLSPVEAAERLGCSPYMIHQYVEQGLLAGRRVRRGSYHHRQVRADDVAAFLEEGETREPEWYSVTQAAIRLEMGRHEVLLYMEMGLLRAKRRGTRHRWYIHRDEVAAFDVAGTEWLTTEEAGKRLGHRAGTVCQLLQRGRLPGRKVRVGRQKMWLVRANVVAQYAQGVTFLQISENPFYK